MVEYMSKKLTEKLDKMIEARTTQASDTNRNTDILNKQEIAVTEDPNPGFARWPIQPGNHCESLKIDPT